MERVGDEKMRRCKLREEIGKEEGGTEERAKGKKKLGKGARRSEELRIGKTGS